MKTETRNNLIFFKGPEEFEFSTHKICVWDFQIFISLENYCSSWRKRNFSILLIKTSVGFEGMKFVHD
jgi:hypothetical protein